MVYINNSRWVNDPSKPQGTGVSNIVADYFMDVPGDIDQLPGTDKIGESSTAFCISTAKVAVLGKDGWVWI